MSLHVQLSPEAEARLRAQKRTSTITSFVIALLGMALIAVILMIISLQLNSREIPVIVGYQNAIVEDDRLTEKKVTSQVQRKPSAPSSSMSKVIASASASPTAVPVPDFDVPEPSTEFGDGDSFGSGWGEGGGFGAGGGGGATFFGQTSSAERIAYVIDVSQSMSGERQKLMRGELQKSLDGILYGTEYALIFFAGPAWVAGNEVNNKGGRENMVVSDKGKKYEWRGRGATKWTPAGKLQQASWITATEGKIKSSKKIVRDQRLIWGTDWSNPLQMALNMDPKPQVVYFMTDGLGANSEGIAKEMGREASKHGIIINCVALLEPKAKKAMSDLAKRSGGQMTMVESGGKVVEVKLK